MKLKLTMINDYCKSQNSKKWDKEKKIHIIFIDKSITV